ncbi:uncharacterized protein F4822DRAFT_354228 [Hypoxylon trugodes]|uniref:uncharacterized protein n=1 Tax=Hypoxylon trugodes TaxID=326681 RepID=UPI00219C37A1|nr:uncharacterized protein F4822DRAFT_354228 [Hypoxylon trugodes]KAI1385768.1 hypothetical protein F4822DRAFT_354228 [Hypoxylon trugodes]
MRRIYAHSSYLRNRNTLPFSKFPIPANRRASSQSRPAEQDSDHREDPVKQNGEATAKMQGKKKKTMAELDAELQQRMSGLSGDGGEAGVEYENGQPVAMKRSVRNNMFRYI